MTSLLSSKGNDQPPDSPLNSHPTGLPRQIDPWACPCCSSVLEKNPLGKLSLPRFLFFFRARAHGLVMQRFMPEALGGAFGDQVVYPIFPRGDVYTTWARNLFRGGLLLVCPSGAPSEEGTARNSLGGLRGLGGAQLLRISGLLRSENIGGSRVPA